MILSLPRATLRVAVLVLVLAVSAACTMQVGGGGKPSVLHAYLGANGLLADPAATAHRPSLDVTLNRLWAARLAGVAPGRTPSSGMVALTLKDSGELEHEDLRVRWSVLTGDEKTARSAVARLGALCGKGSKDADPDCEGTVRSVWAFLTAASSPVLTSLRTTFPSVSAPACPATRTSMSDLYLTALCGGPTPDGATFDEALATLPRTGNVLRDSRSLLVAAVVDAGAGLKSESLHALVRAALAQSQVEGVYLDEVPAQGTVLTSWALLHLAGTDRSGLDTARLGAAIRQEPTDGAADRVMLARAGLSLLGETERPGRAGALKLSDPDGPYNPFIALAARDAGDLDLVSLGFAAKEARTTPERFASFLITRRIIEGSPLTLSAADVTLLERLAPPSSEAAAAGAVPRMLMEAALAAGGRPSTTDGDDLGCGGASWLVDVAGTCDLRASLLVDLRTNFSKQGTS
ncbi:MAG: hypothetical protein ABI336_12965 [Humibacillus sp.]